MSLAVLVGGGEVDLPALERTLPEAGAGLLIGVDGGALALEICGAKPDWVVGDFDSLGAPDLARLEAAGAKIRRYPQAKDQTDLELGLELAAELGTTDAAVFGATGSRIDHTLANLGMLSKARSLGVEARLFAPGQELFLLRPGMNTLYGEAGRAVSLLPLTPEATGVLTEGLRYPLRRETLRIGSSRGVHNEFLAAAAAVSLESGELLAVLFRPGLPA